MTFCSVLVRTDRCCQSSYRFLCLITVCPGGACVLGPLHTLKNGSEGSQRIPIKHVCKILEWFIRNFVFCIMPKSHAGLFWGGYPYIMAREGVKRILPYIHACAQRK